MRGEGLSLRFFTFAFCAEKGREGKGGDENGEILFFTMG